MRQQQLPVAAQPERRHAAGVRMLSLPSSSIMVAKPSELMLMQASLNS